MERKILDLNDWGNVLDRLKAIKKNGQLEHHQDELIKMIKFGGNWRLREAALEATRQIKSPKASLVAAILNVILDDNLYCEARVLACSTLREIIEAGEKDKIGDLTPSAVAGHLRAIVAVPQPPKLAEAVTECLQSLEISSDQQLSRIAR
jgi:hypothetical protein